MKPQKFFDYEEQKLDKPPSPEKTFMTSLFSDRAELLLYPLAVVLSIALVFLYTQNREQTIGNNNPGFSPEVTNGLLIGICVITGIVVLGQAYTGTAMLNSYGVANLRVYGNAAGREAIRTGYGMFYGGAVGFTYLWDSLMSYALLWVLVLAAIMTGLFLLSKANNNKTTAVLGSIFIAMVGMIYITRLTVFAPTFWGRWGTNFLALIVVGLLVTHASYTEETLPAVVRVLLPVLAFLYVCLVVHKGTVVGGRSSLILVVSAASAAMSFLYLHEYISGFNRSRLV